MATIRQEIEIEAPVGDVWDAIRDFAAVHERVAPGFLTALHMDGDGDRIVTFANGMVARERLIGIDDEARRLAYAVISDQLSHHSASIEVLPLGENQTRFVWITDVLPHEVADYIGPMMALGAQATKRTLEAAAVRV
jgi:hypothetical protein